MALIKPDMIPDEVVEAAAKAIAEDAKLNWDDVPYAHNVMRGEARAAIAAAFNSWPGAEVVAWYWADKTLILPLPAEASDE
jgi:hypothetical protein